MTVTPLVRPLPWDTEFFGLPIGRLEAPSPGLSAEVPVVTEASVQESGETAAEEKTGTGTAAGPARTSTEPEPGSADFPGRGVETTAQKDAAAAAKIAALSRAMENGRFVEALESGLAAARDLGLACVYLEIPFTGIAAPAVFARTGFHLADVRTVLSRRIMPGDLEDKDTADGGSGPESNYLTAEEYKETQTGFPAPGAAGRLDESPESGCVDSRSPGAATRGLDDVVIGPPRDGDEAALIPIAEDTAMSSRFRYDPRFGPSEARRLYREWLRRSLHEGYADHVLVARGWAEADHAAIAASSPMDRLEGGIGKATGFLTLRIKDGIPWIDLVGVAAEARGRGIGVRLIRGAAAWAAAHGLDRLDVATQAHNISALALYQKTGFLVRGVSLVYHIWLDEL